MKIAGQYLFTLLLALAVAAIVGGDPPAFLAAACAVCAARWSACLHRPRAIRRYFILDPRTPDAKSLATAFGKVVEEALNSQKTVILRIAAFTAGPRFHPRLSLTHNNDMEISGCARKHAVRHPGAWLADHPLPFDVPLTRSLTLVFAPCAGARVRVAEDALPPVPRNVWAGVALLIAFACVFSHNTLLAAVLAFAGEMWLMRR